MSAADFLSPPPFPHINAFLCLANECPQGNSTPYRDRAALFASNNSAVDTKHFQCLLIKEYFFYIFVDSRSSAATSLRLVCKWLEEQL